MEFVCFEKDGKTPWHFNSADGAYYRNFKDGRHQGKIYGRFLTDPDDLLKKRMEFYDKIAATGAPVLKQQRDQAKPKQETYELFKHWQGVQNAPNELKNLGE